MKHYILINKKPVECDLMTWATAFEASRRIFSTSAYGVDVSTIFLGIDHGFNFSNEKTPPVLFETMVFGGTEDDCQWRWCTYDQAMNGHKRIVHQLDLGFPSNNWFKYYFNKLFKKNEKTDSL